MYSVLCSLDDEMIEIYYEKTLEREPLEEKKAKLKTDIGVKILDEYYQYYYVITDYHITSKIDSLQTIVISKNEQVEELQSKLGKKDKIVKELESIQGRKSYVTLQLNYFQI